MNLAFQNCVAELIKQVAIPKEDISETIPGIAIFSHLASSANFLGNEQQVTEAKVIELNSTNTAENRSAKQSNLSALSSRFKAVRANSISGSGSGIAVIDVVGQLVMHPGHTQARNVSNALGSSSLEINVQHNVYLASFSDGEFEVELHSAPIKTVARMHEKLAEYTAEGIEWPRCAAILDPVLFLMHTLKCHVILPDTSRVKSHNLWMLRLQTHAVSFLWVILAVQVRCSLVCRGATQILEVLDWILKSGLRVCRVKNKFAMDSSELVGGYRDLMVCILCKHPDRRAMPLPTPHETIHSK